MTEREQAIFEFQQYLRNISRAFGEIPLIIPDGNFTDETEQSIKAFQKNNSLPVTGKVDFDTWEKLKDKNNRAVFESSDPRGSFPIKNEDLPLKEGMSSQAVQTLKLMLFNLSGRYSNFTEVEPSLFFDGETANNVLRFQEIAFLPLTGEVDKTTWNSLGDIFSLV